MEYIIYTYCYIVVSANLDWKQAHHPPPLIRMLRRLINTTTIGSRNFGEPFSLISKAKQKLCVCVCSRMLALDLSGNSLGNAKGSKLCLHSDEQRKKV